MSKRRKIKKVNRMFDEYKRYIGAMFVEKFGTSYMRFEDIQDNWRSMVRYTPDAEAELLMYTKVYVRNLNYRCLDAMEILTGQIADFLAEYLVKKHPKEYLLQKRFESKALITDEGESFHVCLGSYSVDGKHAGFYARISESLRIDSNAADIPVLIEGVNYDK